MFIAYKAFIVISILGLATFWLAGKYLPENVSKSELNAWKTTWLFIVTAACFSPNVWVFYAIFLLIVVIQVPKNPQKRIFYYLFLLCTAPQLNIIIPGIAGLPWLFPLSYSRIAIIALLLVIYLKAPNKPRLFQFSADKYVISFLVLIMLLKFRDDTVTNGLRQCFVLFIDIFIPYFVLSRHIQTQNDLNKALYTLFIGLLPIAVIGVFETAKHWLLFSDIYKSLMDKGIFYDIRADGVRAVASTSGGPVLGFVMLVLFSLFLYLQPFIKSRKMVYLAGFIIVLCLLATKARGPWLGFVILIAAYLYTGRAGIRNIFKLLAIGLAILPVILLTPSGQQFIDLLPFIGETRADTVDYRSRLLDQSWLVIQQNPLLGSRTFLEAPELQVMMQGEGIIDIVNTYLQVVLENGFIGLSLFLSIWLHLLYRNYSLIKKLPPEDQEQKRMGRAFLAVMIAIMFTIFTVSSVNYIPVLYWIIIGLLVAYLNITDNSLKAAKIT